MEEKKVLKALECCSRDTRCYEEGTCPLWQDIHCHTLLAIEARDLIKSKNAEIERLTEECDANKFNSGKYNRVLESLSKERRLNAELQKQVDELKLELQGQFDKGVKAGCLMSKVKEEQTVKDTAKEILNLIKNGVNLNGMIEGDAKIAIMNELRWAGQKYGVEVE